MDLTSPMDFRLLKLRRGKSGYEDRPEFRNLIDSLELLKDFGYYSIWLTDEDFVRSINMGGQCSKYMDLLKFLEKNLDMYGKTMGFDDHKLLIDDLRRSTFLYYPNAKLGNAVLLRLINIHRLANRLLELYLKDLRNPQSKPMRFLYSNTCGGVNKICKSPTNTSTTTCTNAITPCPNNVIAKPQNVYSNKVTMSKNARQRKAELNAARFARFTQMAQQIRPNPDGLDLVFECELNISDEELDH